MPYKEWTKSINGVDDVELGIPRASPLIYHCAAPESGKAEGLVFVIPDFGEDPSGEALHGLRAHLAEAHRLLAVTVEYHCLRSRLSDGARLDVSPAELASLSKLCAQHLVALIDPNVMLTALAQLPKPYEFEFHVIPPKGDYQDLGLMQALDHFAVLQDILTSMDSAEVEIGNLLVMGYRYGGYLAHLMAKIAPNTVRAVFEFGGLIEAPLSYLFGSRFGDAPYYYHAGKVRVFPLIETKWSNDKTSSNYFSTSHREIRNMASPQHSAAMRHSAQQPCCYRIGLLSQDKEGFTPDNPLNSENPLGSISPPPCRGRAREGVETLHSHRANPHPNLPPARGKEQFGSGLNVQSVGFVSAVPPVKLPVFVEAKRKQAELLASAGFDVVLREYAVDEVSETTPVALMKDLFDEYYLQLAIKPSTPDHVLGSSIAYLCSDAIYSFEHGAWGCTMNVVPISLPSQPARRYSFF